MSGSHTVQLQWLDPRNPQQPFPDVTLALRNPNGLLAVGGDLTVTRLLNAYQHGIFPWFNPDEPIMWWAPDPRAVFLPGDLHVSKSLHKAIRQADYAVTLDRAFAGVIKACSEEREHRTWLGASMQSAYIELHRRGYAHSVEVWRNGSIIGGLYGIALGRVFFGESMFSRANNASKIALTWLSRQLSAWNFELLDCQVGSDHLARMGARLIPQQEFQSRLKAAITQPIDAPESWHFDIDTPDAPHHERRSANPRKSPLA